MTDASAPFQQDPRFQESLQHFQEERWDSGLEILTPLLEKYPFQPDLRRFHQQILVKKQLDGYEEEEVASARRASSLRLFRRAGIALAFLLVVILGSTTYSSVIQNQITKMQAQIETQYAGIELAIKFRNGQNLLLSGRAEEALVVFEEIYAVDPDYENLDEFMDRARGVLSLDGQYANALDLIEAEQWEDALVILKEIEAEDPNYKNVSILIGQAESSLALMDLIDQADAAFAAENWEDAVAKYEAVRIADANFERDRVETQLLNAYVYAALTVLDDPEAGLEELEIASSYFERALSLRPQDDDLLQIWDRARDGVRSRLVTRYLEEAEAALVNQEDSLAALEIAGYYFEQARRLEPNNEEISLKADLAGRYLQGLTDFRNALWSQVISNMEYIYTFDRDYAAGTNRQVLYDAYVLRGDAYLATGEYELCLADYRRAVELAQENEQGGRLGLYEAQLKVGFTLGRLFEYEGSVLMYQTAIETGDLRTLFSNDPAFLSSLDSAAALAEGRDFRLAYIRYRDLFNQNELVYTEFITHTVVEGEYLSQIARFYNSSIQAIVRANDISDPNKIVAGQELIIPILLDE